MAGFSFVAILAMGQAFPILLRGIDLSIGAIVALVGMVVFDLTLIFHVPGYIILPVALARRHTRRSIERRIDCLPATAALHCDAGDARGLPRPRLLDLRPSARTAACRRPRSPIRGYAASRTTMTSVAGPGSRRLIPMPWFPLSFFLMLAVFRRPPNRADWNALRPQRLYSGRQFRSGASCWHQCRWRYNRGLCHLRILRRRCGAHPCRPLHHVNRSTGHRDGTHGHRRGSHRWRQPSGRDRFNVRACPRRLPSRCRPPRASRCWASSNSSSRSSRA